MPSAKSGSAGSIVAPTAPDDALDADVADPAEIEAAKATDRATSTGKYGSAQIAPFQPDEAPADEDPAVTAVAGEGSAAAASDGDSTSATTAEEQVETSWIEIELVDEDDKPVTGEKYRVTLPDGSVAEGTLDEKGFARVEGFAPGSCQITFPDLDQDAWESK